MTIPARGTVWIAGAGQQTLVKHPSESRVYAVDFTQLFAQSALQGQSETFGQTLTMPLIFSLVPAKSVSMGVTRQDWQPVAGDLLVGPVTFSGGKVQFLVGGGTDGMTYTFTVSCPTTMGNVLVGVGVLQVSRNVG
jgi:hypothetical protein